LGSFSEFSGLVYFYIFTLIFALPGAYLLSQRYLRTSDEVVLPEATFKEIVGYLQTQQAQSLQQPRNSQQSTSKRRKFKSSTNIATNYTDSQPTLATSANYPTMQDQEVKSSNPHFKTSKGQNHVQSSTCINCGETNNPQNHFCEICGEKLQN